MKKHYGEKLTKEQVNQLEKDKCVIIQKEELEISREFNSNNTLII